MRNLAAVIFLAALTGCASTPASQSRPCAEYTDPEVYEICLLLQQERDRQRLRDFMNHGKGGCVPDPVFGGCL